jgi:serine/threonine protein kinase HipA of HipAB toxin-antitoxin module
MQLTPNAERWMQRLRAPRLALAPALHGNAVPSLVRHWDELAAAVCDRLARLAESGSEPALREGVHECVAALQQLHACMAVGRSNAPRPTLQPRTRRASSLVP